MRLISFQRGGKASWGWLDGEKVREASQAMRARFPTVRSLLAGGVRPQASDAGDLLAMDEVRLRPPVTDPGKVICVGINYDEHRRETGRDLTEHPTIFLRFADTHIAHGDAIIRPRVSTALDFEGELAVVIGKGGRAIPRDEAMAHIAGYSCYNDASIRDWQRHTSQFTPGKNFPGTGAFGPWLVTADEIADLDAETLTTRLNGEIVQQSGIDHMIFSVADIIAYVSAFTTLSPGDVIATGTPGGVGFKRTPPLFMKPGDTVEVEITGIGTLVNPVVDEA